MWKTKSVDIELQPDANIYYKIPHPVLISNNSVFNKSLEIICQLGELKKMKYQSGETPLDPTKKQWNSQIIVPF